MEVIKPGTEDINKMAVLGCCWPPGTENLEMPEEN
jgi:hypothetical protein